MRKWRNHIAVRMQYWNVATKNRATDAMAQPVERKALSLTVVRSSTHRSVGILVKRILAHVGA